MVTYNPGKLVKYRDRRWIVIPSDDPELMLLKPLGGSDHEITGIYNPLRGIPGEEIREDLFPPPTIEELGDYQTAKLLFEACRLSFRNASGPFRCMGKLSFRPRSYQMVPLVMALKLPVIRLLIADDVGIGKTIEALVILKEMMERGDIRRFAVVCPPHLCDQWQMELNDKLDIQAEIIRSSTTAWLERRLPDDRSVFYHYPYQVISIDYIKGERHRQMFLNDCPEMVILDEAHTCTLPAGASARTQQQRHFIMNQVARRPNQHLIMLTATPHSGKDVEFRSLLGMLNPEFEKYELDSIEQAERRRIASHFIQRKRENILHWAGQDTPFPKRDSGEIPYKLSPAYKTLYYHALDFAKGLTREGLEIRGSRVRYWAALALLRGMMSSPAAGLEMVRNRQQRRLEETGDWEQLENPNFERLEGESDTTQQELLDYADLKSSERAELIKLQNELEKLQGTVQDVKARIAIRTIHEWLKEGFQPIVFCRYIASAKYLGELMQQELPQKYTVRVVTSELADEQRKEEVERLGKEPNHVMVATDCLSEGINLQDHFTAVLHYDLPWNPNRLEQREGRVDRFGQTAPTVKTFLIWAEDNPIDMIVLQILIRKVRAIQKSIGVSIPLAEDNQSIMDAILMKIILDPRKQDTAVQGRLDFGDTEMEEQNARITRELEAAKEKAVQLRNIFTHSTVSQEDIEVQLKEVDEAIGDMQSVEAFVIQGLNSLGVTVRPDGKGYVFSPVNLPTHLRYFFNGEQQAYISFESPTPKGYRYIGRNNRFTEQLCQFIMALSFDGHPNYHRIARTAVVRTDAVTIKTTLVQFRVRNVIRESSSRRDVISEEMYLWGYVGSDPKGKKLEFAEAKKLLREAQTVANISLEGQQRMMKEELKLFEEMKDPFIQLAERRAENLVEAHSRFRSLVGGRRYEKVYPILPPDIMGIYILLPPVRSL
ncbi:MAG: helicase-related protein [Bacteroidales bacterium]|nr:helicase-related protein [Bacteroidales bacterium]